MEKSEEEDRQQEGKKQKAERNRLLEVVAEANKGKSRNSKRKHEKKINSDKIGETIENTRMDMDVDVKEVVQSVKVLHPNVKELLQSVKDLHPECVEFSVEGNGACCLNCLAAFIYPDSHEGPTLERDVNTHIAMYREEYRKRLVFPRSVNVGNSKVKEFKEGDKT